MGIFTTIDRIFNLLVFSLISFYLAALLLLLVILLVSRFFTNFDIAKKPILKRQSSWITMHLAFFNYKLNLDTDHRNKLYDKYSAYECGFDTFSDARVPFTIHFYLIAILFLIFDLEIIFLFPIAITAGSLASLSYFISINIALIFLYILGLGFFYEYKKGALEFLQLFTLEKA